MDEKRQCNFFVKKRKRFCRLIPGKGKRFCGEHINLETECIGGQGENDQPSTGRIPCPYDSHHTVAAKQLTKHLKVCNSRPKEQPVYYQKGINAGKNECDNDFKMLRLASFSLDELQQIISKVESAYIDHIGSIETHILHHDALKAELESPENGVSAKKHLLQLDSLLGHMTRLDLLQPDTCFVEFGAGRGRLSQWIQQAMSDLDKTSFLLIDRAAVRHKRDAFYRDNGGAQYERISMDIENLVLGKVPTVCNHANRPVVAYTKHLCGAATDLALRCLMETGNRNEPSLPHSSSNTPIKTDEPKGKDNSVRQELLTLQTSSHNSNNTGSNYNGSHKECPQGPTDPLSTKIKDTTPSNRRELEGVHHENSRPCEVDEAVDRLTNTNHPLVSNPVKGVVMALCCHHRCSWRTHVGKQFFLDEGISEREYMALVRMTSWATCGYRAPKKEENNGIKEEEDKGRKEDGVKVPSGVGEGDGYGRKTTQEAPGSEEQEDRSKEGKEKIRADNSDVPEEQESVVSSLGLSVPEREEVGFKCKRILDMGRLLYLRNHGLDAKLVYYVERNISPENAVLIATPLIQ